jgi:hypothetical protein
MDSVNHGEASDYNLFNTQAYHENDIVLEAQKLTKVEPNAILYSNFVDVIWFYTRKDAFILPSAFVANPNQVYAGWPYNKNGAYIFWFEPYEFGFDLPPNQIAKFADLHVIFRSSQGKIYFAQAQQL